MNPPVKGVPARVSIDYVSTHDGTSCTILLAENNNNSYRKANNIHIFWNQIEGSSPWATSGLHCPNRRELGRQLERADADPGGHDAAADRLCGECILHDGQNFLVPQRRHRR